MKGMHKQYKIIDPDTGDVLCAGNAKKCAEFVGAEEKTFRKRVWEMMEHGRGTYRGYCIETDQPTWTKDAIKEWNNFTEPLRRKYGIPVYRPGKDGG